MDKYLLANADHGVDTLLKAVGVLRRKAIKIHDVKMTSVPEQVYAQLEIHLEQTTDHAYMQALAQLNKIVGLRDVQIREV